jgi:hypothetical protein
MQAITVTIDAGEETPDSVADELYEIILGNLPSGWTLVTVSAKVQS